MERHQPTPEQIKTFREVSGVSMQESKLLLQEFQGSNGLALEASRLPAFNIRHAIEDVKKKYGIASYWNARPWSSLSFKEQTQVGQVIESMCYREAYEFIVNLAGEKI